LAVALRVASRSLLVVEAEQRVKLLRNFIAELSTPIRDDFKRKSKTTNPSVKNCRSYRDGFLVGQNDKFHVFGKSVCHA
jgi:hypothetical protein